MYLSSGNYEKLVFSEYTPMHIPNEPALPCRIGVFHQEQHGVRRIQLRRGATGAAHQEDGGGSFVPRQHGHSQLGVVRAERHRQNRGRLRPGPHGGSLRHGGDGGGAQGAVGGAAVRGQGGEPKAVHGRRGEGADGRTACHWLPAAAAGRCPSRSRGNRDRNPVAARTGSRISDSAELFGDTNFLNL